MSLLDTLDPSFKPAAQSLYDLAERAGVRPRITSARRSYAKQAALYKAYQEGRSRYPAAPPGTSAHEYGLAFDMVVDNATDQNDLGAVWTQAGWVYGGEEDPIHYAAPFTPMGAQNQNGTAQSSSGDILYTTAQTRQLARQLADLLIGFVPGLSSIVGIAGMTNAILQVVGVGPNAGTLLAWGLSHPFEFLGAFWDAMWAILKSYF